MAPFAAQLAYLVEPFLGSSGRTAARLAHLLEDPRTITRSIRLTFVAKTFERIGDQAVNIAERALVLSKLPPIDIPFDFAGMTEKTQGMVKDSLDALERGLAVGLEAEYQHRGGVGGARECRRTP